MELHGYQDPVRCRAFAITLKGPTLAWFNRLPPSSVSSFRELSITFVSHFIGARTFKKPGYHLLTIKQSLQESPRSEVQCRVSEGRCTRREVRYHCIHHWLRSAVKRFDVLHIQESTGKHGRGACQRGKVHKRRGGPHIQERKLFNHKETSKTDKKQG